MVSPNKLEYKDLNNERKQIPLHYWWTAFSHRVLPALQCFQTERDAGLLKPFLRTLLKKSRIRETKNPSTNANISTDTEKILT